MYGREYAGRELRFEASGGLLNAALVMQDKETGSYWAIMEGESLAGDYAGTRLEELPLGGNWKLTMDGSVDATGAFGVKLGPGGTEAVGSPPAAGMT